MIKPEIKADISDSTNNVLKELALPASTQIGQALGNVFGLVNTLTLPAKLANEYAQKNFNKYNDKLNDIPKEKIRQVEPEIAIPIIEKLTYTTNNDLADAYAKLLANASNIDMVDYIHPGFINKLNNMAPDEVKILQTIKERNYDDIPYIIFQAKHEKAHHSKTISFKITDFHDKLNLSPRNASVHFNNLISLNIISDLEGHYLLDDSQYTNLIDRYNKVKAEYEKEVIEGVHGVNMKLVTDKSMYRITTLGKTFIEACTK